jgi:Immunoglobulin I-set domain
VLVPPQISGNVMEKLVIVEGKEFSLICEFDAIPPPTITWKRDMALLAVGGAENSKLLNGNQTLYVDKASSLHTGLYECELNNSAGRAKRTFEVKIIFRPPLADEGDITTIEVNSCAPPHYLQNGAITDPAPPPGDLRLPNHLQH